MKNNNKGVQIGTTGAGYTGRKKTGEPDKQINIHEISGANGCEGRRDLTDKTSGG